ncbi:Leucine carboxyl methyltransferase 1 [Rhodotorula toruloides ATCC 204091]|uniref:Leucine carboxyl methyltransferase 1 n=1 Tax=Rhodotorula toruloides TaxID=5286 RepID=A0A2T0A8V0_RHOTO|nr:Leucine carboxyl methyltransferase 1 [Rhodotorula toruloides ATCC 204091]KAK4336229.1 Leucine carboxyl methyltransferase 1 [Rhodotorula toruloides]PRQ74447.1 leucine carboxyl methyltransferase 1 [Rhodotorula toruloides]
MLPPSRLSNTPTNPDAAVRGTDSDALLSRHSAASLGYLDDPFSALFLSPAQRRTPERRPPLINIGTHARTWAVDELVEQFLLQREVGDSQTGQAWSCQVLSLGAGTDTRFWRLRRKWEAEGREWACRKWVEVDFPEATGSKARAVSGKAELKSRLGGDVKIEQGGLGLSSPLYALLPGDLRNFDALSVSLLSPPAFPSTSASTDPILLPSLPTLLLLECVLVYLPPPDTDAILLWFASTFAPGSAVVSYDPFGLDDSFGKVMRRNLALRSLTLPGADSTPSLASLTSRLEKNGINGSTGSMSVREIRDEVVPVKEKERVSKLENLDEVEELNLVLEHYAVTWGNVGGRAGGIGLKKR